MALECIILCSIESGVLAALAVLAGEWLKARKLCRPESASSIVMALEAGIALNWAALSVTFWLQPALASDNGLWFWLMPFSMLSPRMRGFWLAGSAWVLYAAAYPLIAGLIVERTHALQALRESMRQQAQADLEQARKSAAQALEAQRRQKEQELGQCLADRKALSAGLAQAQAQMKEREGKIWFVIQKAVELKRRQQQMAGRIEDLKNHRDINRKLRRMLIESGVVTRTELNALICEWDRELREARNRKSGKGGDGEAGRKNEK